MMHEVKGHGLHVLGAAAALLVLGFVVYAFSTLSESDSAGPVPDPVPDTVASAEDYPGGEIPEPAGPVTGVRNGESFGPEAPAFTLPEMEGGIFRLSDHLGEVVIVNFWATWCAPCREEMPGFVRLQTEFADEGVQFVGVSLDEQGFSVVRPFAEELEINYPLVADEDWTVAALYGAGHTLPATFLINRRGQVVAHLPGLLPEDALRPMLTELIRKGGT